MLELSAKITIKSEKTWVFSQIHSCEIERDIEKVTATCNLLLPRRTKWRNEAGIPVKRGDGIRVELGYDGKLHEVFTGYIKRVGVQTPIEIECEDEMFLLKNTAAKKKSYRNANLQTLLKDQLPAGIPSEVFSRQAFGQYAVNSDTVAQCLGELAENGFLFFFRGGTLYAGMVFDHSTAGKRQVFREGEYGNITDSSDLTWNSADEITLQIKASGTDSKGKKIQVEVGDKEGEVRSFFKYNTTKAALEAEAKKKLTEWKVSGLSGSFTAFCARPVGLLERIKVSTMEHPAKDYTVVKNVISYGTDGLRQEVGIKS
jgi:hypothetical protein